MKVLELFNPSKLLISTHKVLVFLKYKIYNNAFLKIYCDVYILLIDEIATHKSQLVYSKTTLKL